MKRIILLMICFILVMFSMKTSATFSVNMDEGFYYPNHFYVEKKVYYINTNDFKIYVAEKNNFQKPLFDDEIDEIGFIIKDNEVIYKSKNDGYLYKYNILSKSKFKLSRNKLSRSYGSFFILQNKIYYYDEKEELRKIYGNNDLEALPYEVTVANALQENQVCFDDMILTWGQNGIYKIDLGNYMVHKLYDGVVYSLTKDDENVYFINENLNVVSIDLTGRKRKIICNNKTINFGADFYLGKVMFDDGYIYFIEYLDNENYLVRINTQYDKKQILLQDVSDFYVKNNKLFYFSNIDKDYIKYLDIKSGRTKILSKNSYISLLDFKNDVLCVLVKSNNADNWLGELRFLRVE